MSQLLAKNTINIQQLSEINNSEPETSSSTSTMQNANLQNLNHKNANIEAEPMLNKNEEISEATETELPGKENNHNYQHYHQAGAAKDTRRYALDNSTLESDHESMSNSSIKNSGSISNSNSILTSQKVQRKEIQQKENAHKYTAAFSDVSKLSKKLTNKNYLNFTKLGNQKADQMKVECMGETNFLSKIARPNFDIGIFDSFEAFLNSTSTYYQRRDRRDEIIDDRGHQVFATCTSTRGRDMTRKSPSTPNISNPNRGLSLDDRKTQERDFLRLVRERGHHSLSRVDSRENDNRARRMDTCRDQQKNFYDNEHKLNELNRTRQAYERALYECMGHDSRFRAQLMNQQGLNQGPGLTSQGQGLRIDQFQGRNSSFGSKKCNERDSGYPGGPRVPFYQENNNDQSINMNSFQMQNFHQNSRLVGSPKKQISQNSQPSPSQSVHPNFSHHPMNMKNVQQHLCQPVLTNQNMNSLKILQQQLELQNQNKKIQEQQSESPFISPRVPVSISPVAEQSKMIIDEPVTRKDPPNQSNTLTILTDAEDSDKILDHTLRIDVDNESDNKNDQSVIQSQTTPEQDFDQEIDPDTDQKIDVVTVSCDMDDSDRITPNNLAVNLGLTSHSDPLDDANQIMTTCSDIDRKRKLDLHGKSNERDNTPPCIAISSEDDSKRAKFGEVHVGVEIKSNTMTDSGIQRRQESYENHSDSVSDKISLIQKFLNQNQSQNQNQNNQNQILPIQNGPSSQKSPSDKVRQMLEDLVKKNTNQAKSDLENHPGNPLLIRRASEPAHENKNCDPKIWSQSTPSKINGQSHENNRQMSLLNMNSSQLQNNGPYNLPFQIPGNFQQPRNALPTLPGNELAFNLTMNAATGQRQGPATLLSPGSNFGNLPNFNEMIGHHYFLGWIQHMTKANHYSMFLIDTFCFAIQPFPIHR